jgi:hypothetical protein
MTKKTLLSTLPLPVTQALRKLGHDIKDARRRRRIPMAIAAQRASISKPTLIKVERGDPGVSIGSYATVLFVMGVADRLSDLVDPKNDPWACDLKKRICQNASAQRGSEPRPRTISHAADAPTFGAIGDSAPDRWGACSCNGWNAGAPNERNRRRGRCRKLTTC